MSTPTKVAHEHLSIVNDAMHQWPECTIQRRAGMDILASADFMSTGISQQTSASAHLSEWDVGPHGKYFSWAQHH